MRSKISSKLIFASCVWYSDRAHYELCVLIRDLGRRLPLQLQCSYQGQQDDFSQSVRGNYKTRLWGGQNLTAVKVYIVRCMLYTRHRAPRPCLMAKGRTPARPRSTAISTDWLDFCFLDAACWWINRSIYKYIYNCVHAMFAGGRSMIYYDPQQGGVLNDCGVPNNRWN